MEEGRLEMVSRQEHGGGSADHLCRTLCYVCCPHHKKAIVWICLNFDWTLSLNQDLLNRK
jgi:hypothetical protein